MPALAASTRVAFFTVLLATWGMCLRSEEAAYQFTLDGEPWEPSHTSLDGEAESLAPGDIVTFERLSFVLDEPGSYDLRIERSDEDGNEVVHLFRVDSEGRRTLVALKFEVGFEDVGSAKASPLSRLTKADARSLRGLRFPWSAGIDCKVLDWLDPERVFVTVESGYAALAESRVPELPEALRYLEVDSTSSSAFPDLRNLERYTALRFLRVHTIGDSPLSLDVLRGAGELRRLDLSMVDVEDLEALSSLLSLRHLDLSWCDDVVDVGFARELRSLRSLYLQRSGVRDLGPLGGLPDLARVNADGAPVAALPAEPLPSLRELRVMSTRLSAEQVAVFTALNPRCRVLHRWRQHLVESLEGVTRVRVRSGGTCHRRTAEEETLAELRDAEDISALIATLQIDEAQGAGHCMCCGEPSLEFYRDEQLVVTLGFHHGRSLRWPGGWPGDGVMTDEGGEALCRALAQAGVEGPLEEFEESLQSRRAMRRYQELVAELLPEATFAKLRQARSADDALEAFTSTLTEAGERAAIALALLGLDERAWNEETQIDSLMEESVLPELDAAIVASAVRQARKPDALNGASCWLFDNGNWKLLEKRDRQILLPRLAEYALASPREVNRRRTLLALEKVVDAGYARKEIVALLRRALMGRIEERQLTSEQQNSAANTVSFQPGGDRLSTTASLSASAATVLSWLDDRDSLAALREALGDAEGEDRELIAKAIEALERKEES